MSRQFLWGSARVRLPAGKTKETHSNLIRVCRVVFGEMIRLEHV